MSALDIKRIFRCFSARGIDIFAYENFYMLCNVSCMVLEVSYAKRVVFSDAVNFFFPMLTIGLWCSWSIENFPHLIKNGYQYQMVAEYGLRCMGSRC
jgi:hypothetical protein